MQQLAETCEAVAATTKKTEKIRLVAGYFQSHPAEAPQAAIFLSGRALSRLGRADPAGGRGLAVAGRG